MSLIRTSFPFSHTLICSSFYSSTFISNIHTFIFYHRPTHIHTLRITLLSLIRTTLILDTLYSHFPITLKPSGGLIRRAHSSSVHWSVEPPGKSTAVKNRMIIRLPREKIRCPGESFETFIIYHYYLLESHN